MNILAQPVAFPQLLAGSGSSSVSPSLAGKLVQNLSLPCGDFVTFWNGLVTATGRQAPSGPYGVEVFIDNIRQPGTQKVFFSK